MVKLNKIYTRTGDNGTTGLVDGPRRFKHDLRVEAYGTVDETNSLRPMLDKMDRLRAASPKPQREGDRRLFGRATTVGTWFIFVGPSAATVNLNADGSATLITSGVEIGSGTMMQSLPQIVAAQLGTFAKRFNDYNEMKSHG